MAPTAQQFLDRLLSQDGDKYVWGAKVDAAVDNPAAFDCSSLVQWACGNLGVSPALPRTASAQFRHANQYGLIIPVAEALKTPGALLGRFNAGENPLLGPPASGQGHIAVSQGDGRTIEARSAYYGVGQFPTAGRKWSIGALVPGLNYKEDAQAVWSKPGNSIQTVEDADAVFAYQGSIMAGKDVGSYLMGVSDQEFRRGVLLGIARITDILMQHDTRLRKGGL